MRFHVKFWTVYSNGVTIELGWRGEIRFTQTICSSAYAMQGCISQPTPINVTYLWHLSMNNICGNSCNHSAISLGAFSHVTTDNSFVCLLVWPFHVASFEYVMPSCTVLSSCHTRAEIRDLYIYISVCSRHGRENFPLKKSTSLSRNNSFEIWHSWWLKMYYIEILVI
jgi:hypothetical protein